MGFLESGPIGLVRSTLGHSSPLYVQYYITARCNLRCQQCNVIYANSDLQEAGTEKSLKAIENLGKIGTNVLLFTGGEPFMRKDLPLLVKKAIESKIHPRIQTNGIATVAELQACVKNGVKDISISLDSLASGNQDFLNGDFDNSWLLAIDTIANVTQIFPEDAFCAFGCVFSPHNFREVTKVIKFAAQIGWYVSLVPAHVTSPTNARSFSTFDTTLNFPIELQEEACDVIDEVIALKRSGLPVYDSEEFLENMKLFIQKKPLTWRARNNNKCDAGSLYFAVMPDTSAAVCCDYRLTGEQTLTSESNFPTFYNQGKFARESLPIIKACSGCLYGSYPEISISARYPKASFERVKEFLIPNKTRIKSFTRTELIEIAAVIDNG